MPESGTPVELLRGLAVLAEPPSKEHEGIIAALGIQATPTSSEYSDVFMFQLYPYASVHLGQEGMMGGDARERVAGFWTAVGQTPPAEPDHLSALLGLYVGLTEQITIANTEGSSAEAMLLDQSRGALMQEHLAPWVFAYLDRVVEFTSGPYVEWATLLRDVLRSEVTSGGALPVHLREAPPLADPRKNGSEAFLAGLFAPVRSGAISLDPILVGLHRLWTLASGQGRDVTRLSTSSRRTRRVFSLPFPRRRDDRLRIMPLAKSGWATRRIS